MKVLEGIDGIVFELQNYNRKDTVVVCDTSHKALTAFISFTVLTWILIALVVLVVIAIGWYTFITGAKNFNDSNNPTMDEKMAETDIIHFMHHIQSKSHPVENINPYLIYVETWTMKNCISWFLGLIFLDLTYGGNPLIPYQVTLAQAIPVYIDDYHVSIFGWKINVKSRIFEYANSKEIINGWTLIDKNLKILGSSILGLFLPISRSMLIDYNSILPFFGKSSIPSIPTSTAINSGIISLLQLAYWYSKCSTSSSTFGLKEIELLEDLLEHLMNQAVI